MSCLTGRWLDHNIPSSMYKVTLESNGLSCSVETVRPSGDIIFTRSLIYLGSIKNDVQKKRRVLWGDKYVLAEAPSAFNIIKWVHKTLGRACFVWRRCDGESVSSVSRCVAVLPGPCQRRRRHKTQLKQCRRLMHDAPVQPDEDECILLSAPCIVKHWWLAD